MLTVRNLRYSYGKGILALSDISLDIPTGFSLIIGENGSGKSTLIKAIASILPVSGKIAIRDIDVSNPNYKDAISYLPQEFSIYPKLKVRDILAFVASMRRLDKKLIDTEVNRVAELVNITRYLDTRFKKCSLGTQRRVGIATTLLGISKVILLDEPTAGIDPKERIGFYKTIKSAFQDIHVVISTHILDDIDILADYVVMISNGRVAYSGCYSDFKSSLVGKVYEFESTSDKHEIALHNLISKTQDNGKVTYRYAVNNYQRLIEGSKCVEPTSEDLWLYYQLKNRNDDE